MKKLENKTVFITGGLSGVGKACAMAAAREGANVAIADIYTDSTERTMEEIKKENPNAFFIDCDVSKFTEVEYTVKKVIDRFTTIDVALNNAGIIDERNNNDNISKEAWLQLIGINLNGIFNCMSHELPEMAKRKKGVILNMAFILSKPSFATSSHYEATKHGIIGLTKTAAIEYARQGIRINALCPGFIDPVFEDKKEGALTMERRKKGLVSLLSPSKIKKTEEIANGFVFMACDKSPFITGTAVEIDGGYLSQ